MRLGDYLREHRERIMERWERAVREQAATGGLDRQRLRDHLPEFLDRIAAISADRAAARTWRLPERIPTQHALERLDEGFSLVQVANEFAVLRRVFLESLEEDGVHLESGELIVFNAAIDQGVTLSVTRFVEARERTLRAVDRISAAALRTGDFDELLPRLAEAFLEAHPASDTLAVFLADEEGLHLRATVGLEEDLAARARLKVGEGIAGLIAARRAPVLLGAPEIAHLAGLGALRRRGLTALFGAPLLHGEQMVGVAFMGSRTAPSYSPEDQFLLRTMCERAATLLVQAQLSDAERSARVRAEEALEMVDTLLHSSTRRAAELRASERRFQLALHNMKVVVFEQDRELRYVWIYNPHFELEEQQVLGKTDFELFESGEVAALVALKERVLRTGEAAGGELTVGLGGVERRFALEIEAQRDAHGEVVGIVGAASDITESKRIEEELRAAAEFRDRILAVVTHDLRNPLQAIRMAGQVLSRSEELPARLGRPVARLLSSTDRMSRMIADLLDYTRSRFGEGIPIDREPTDLAEVLRHVVDELELGAPGRKVRASLPGPLVGSWDADRLSQVVSNLVSNALAHGDPAEPIDVAMRQQEGEAVLTVQNRGATIPRERQRELFEPFVRGGRGGEGLGLGLYIVQEIVRAHGGEVSVRSEEGLTTFTVRLPLEQPAAAPALH